MPPLAPDSPRTRRPRRATGAAVTVGLLGLVACGLLPPRRPTVVESAGAPAPVPTTRVPRPAPAPPGPPPGHLVNRSRRTKPAAPAEPVAVTTTVPEPVAEPTGDGATTEPAPEETTTTTEAPPEPPTTVPAPAPERCDGENLLRVVVRGSDGAAVGAQVSADFTRHGQKVDASGQPIPADQYSHVDHVSDGERTVCVQAAPGTELFVEVYPKVLTDGVVTGTDPRYGAAMWHGVWPGRGQGVTLTLPKACDPEAGVQGRTGTIRVTATDGGAPTALTRLVAWSRAAGSSSRTPGFGVADAEQLGTGTVDYVNRLAPDQNYLLQAETDTGRIITFDPVPVAPCQETKVSLEVDGRQCHATVDDGEPAACKLPRSVVG